MLGVQCAVSIPCVVCGEHCVVCSVRTVSTSLVFWNFLFQLMTRLSVTDRGSLQDGHCLTKYTVYTVYKVYIVNVYCTLYSSCFNGKTRSFL